MKPDRKKQILASIEAICDGPDDNVLSMAKKTAPLTIELVLSRLREQGRHAIAVDLEALVAKEPDWLRKLEIVADFCDSDMGSGGST